MTTGLEGGRTDSEREWVLEFCGFKYPSNDTRGRGAWYISPKPGGKSKGEGITVIHPDTGYTSHPELLKGGRYLTDNRAKNFILKVGNALARDPLTGVHKSHGTSTASVIVSAEGHPNAPPPAAPRFPDYVVPSTNFVSGVAPMVEVIPCRVADKVILEDVNESNLAKAIYYAMSLDEVPSRIGVISISLGTVNLSIGKSIKEALHEARKAGIVICAAAGQLLENNSYKPSFPGSDPNTICVAACDYQNKKYKKGFYGPAVDITAPGVNIWMAKTTRRGGGARVEIYSVEQSEGTSYATAIVAGACALWQAHHGRANLISNYGRHLIFDLFKKVLQDSCYRPPTWDTANCGAGVLDAIALLNHPLPPKSVIEQLRDDG